MNNAEVLITEGVTGSGKTYTRVCDFVKNRLRFSKGKVITNLPLNVEAIDKYLKKRVRNATAVSDRVLILDRETVLSWTPVEVFETDTREVSGPWELDLEKYFPCHLALDESQHYVGINQRDEVITQWVRFLSEIRHEGMTIEFITQSADSLHPLIRSKAGKILQVLDGRTMQDPFWGIEMNDWYQLLMGWQFWWAKRTTAADKIDSKKFWNVLPFAVQTLVAAGKKKKKEGKPKHYVRSGDIFDLYNSFSAPLYSEHTGDPKRAPEMWQENSLLQLNAWFFSNHWSTILFSKMTIMACMITLLIVFMLSGGMKTVLPMATTRLSRWMSGTAIKSQKSDTRADAPGKKPAASVPPPDASIDPMTLPTPEAVKYFVDQERNARLADQQQFEQQRAILEKTVEIMQLQAAKQNEVVLISGENAVLVSGERISVGSVLTTGIYKGRRVEAINEKQRTVTLANNIVLGMPVVMPDGLSRTPDLPAGGRPSESQPDRQTGTAQPGVFNAPLSRPVSSTSQSPPRRNGIGRSREVPRGVGNGNNRDVPGN